MDTVAAVADDVRATEMRVAWGGRSDGEKTAPRPTPTFVPSVAVMFLRLAALLGVVPPRKASGAGAASRPTPKAAVS